MFRQRLSAKILSLSARTDLSHSQVTPSRGRFHACKSSARHEYREPASSIGKKDIASLVDIHVYTARFMRPKS